MFIIGRLPGVERPALATMMPTEKKPVLVLDVGANVDCRPYHLFQFGLMGEAFARDLLDYSAPRISLLSIGEEEGKGNSLVKEAYELLKMAQNLNFVGNAEGRDIFTGNLDVVVCDGFVGNVVLKLSEGIAGSLTRMFKKVFMSGILPALGGMLAKSAFKKFAHTVDYAEYGGAPLLGLRELVIVCHGRSDVRAISNAVKMSGFFVRKGVNTRLAEIILANEELTRFSRAI
jgi:glycerol-3-phosphate acyltransferase PlsX